ncbi:Uncharacterised protein [Bordetella pertussis]|nr:Uncharacterised protein [Bordetella pertussis]
MRKPRTAMTGATARSVALNRFCCATLPIRCLSS